MVCTTLHLLRQILALWSLSPTHGIIVVPSLLRRHQQQPWSHVFVGLFAAAGWRWGGGRRSTTHCASNIVAAAAAAAAARVR